MKKLNLMLIGVFVLGLAACATDPNKELACVFPDDGLTRAPDWVCGGAYKDLKILAVGSHEKTRAGFEFQKTMATAVARDVMARQARVQVQGMVKQYVETSGSADTETVDRINASLSKQITKEDLRGTRVYTTRLNPKTKTLFVLVGMDTKLAQAFAKQQIKTSMKNERALWQKLEAKKSFGELAEEMSKL